MRRRYFALALLAAMGANAAQAQQYGATPHYGDVSTVAFDPVYGQASQVAYDPVAIAEPQPESAMPAPAVDGAAGCTACEGTADCGCEECCDSCGLFDRLGIFNGCWQPCGVFVNFEYTMWWTKERNVVPLVTTSPLNTPQLQSGVLPGAEILFGGGGVGDDLGHGGRFTFGKWLDPHQTAAIAARLTTFRADDGELSTDTNAFPNLSVPFFDAEFGINNAYQVGFVDPVLGPFSAGNVAARDRMDLLAAEVYGQFLMYEETGMRVDLIGGYHFLRLDNELSLDTNLVSLNPLFIAPVGTTIATEDTFEGRNQFHGGTLGFTTTFDHNRWFVIAAAKISVGNMNQTILIDGNTVVTTPGPTVDVRDEGIFALGTNQGVRSRDKIAYIPEANLKLGYRLRQNVAVTMGYDFMYISSVVLGGDQVNPNLNLSQTNGGLLVGPREPAFLGFRDTDFWAQGLNFGLEVAF